MAKSEKKEEKIDMAKYGDLVTKASNCLASTMNYNAYKDNKMDAENSGKFPQAIAKYANSLNGNVFKDEHVNTALNDPQIGPEGVARDANGFLNDYLYDKDGPVQTSLDTLLVPGFKTSVANSQIPYQSYFILKNLAGTAGVAVDEEKLMDKNLKAYLNFATIQDKNSPERKAALESLVGAYIDNKVNSLKTTDAEKKRERWYLEKYSKYMTSGMGREAVNYVGQTSIGKMAGINVNYAEAIGSCNDNVTKLKAITSYEKAYAETIENLKKQKAEAE